jgi:hypothetical protein
MNNESLRPLRMAAQRLFMAAMGYYVCRRERPMSPALVAALGALHAPETLREQAALVAALRAALALCATDACIRSRQVADACCAANDALTDAIMTEKRGIIADSEARYV